MTWKSEVATLLLSMLVGIMGYTVMEFTSTDTVHKFNSVLAQAGAGILIATGFIGVTSSSISLIKRFCDLFNDSKPF